MNETSQTLLSPEDVKERLGLKNVDTLSVWRCTQRYPQLRYIKVGRLVRYRQEDVESFLRSRTIGSDD